MEIAIYCGLIINEIITNAYKYAFNEERGEINISFYKNEGIYKLIWLHLLGHRNDKIL
jgi:two-component sensor histidine kinase